MFQSFTEISAAKIAELKSFCLSNSIIPAGDKRLLATWQQAVWAFIQEQAIPAIKTGASKAYQVATSERAIALYHTIIVWVLTAIVVASILFWRGVKAIAVWVWANRDKTAVYHWYKDGRSAFLGSDFWAKLRSFLKGSVGASQQQREEFAEWARAIVLAWLGRLGLITPDCDINLRQGQSTLLGSVNRP